MGGLSASMYFFAVSQCMPTSLATARIDTSPLENDGKTVAVVEDGINVAPALAQAHVGIAIDTGTDVAEEAADMTLAGSELQSVATGVSLSRTTKTTISRTCFGRSTTMCSSSQWPQA